MTINTKVKQQIARLETKKLDTLKEEFSLLYGFECGETNARNLRRRIAYKLQEIHEGGLSADDIERLKSLAAADPLSNLENRPSKKFSKTIGTRFQRIWKGVVHEVIVQDNEKFEYQGKMFKSLSAIARLITGTRWNGKVFFGVNVKKAM